MATIGVSKPMYAIYDTSTGVPAYRDGGILGKAVEVGIDVESSDSDNLYADNGIAETAGGGFTKGTFTITTDDLSDEASIAILGVREQPITDIEGLTTQNPTELVYDDTQNTPNLGIGFIIKKQIGNVIKWRAVILAKVMFSVPSTAATTQGETIEWQTPELEATIARDDTAQHKWKTEAMFDTEADAALYIKARLNIVDNLPALTVTSAAGTAAGNTILTVTPALTSGNSYKYKTGANVVLPLLNEVITAGYTDWNGTAEIAATNGEQIAVVEVNAANQALAGGIATVVSNATEVQTMSAKSIKQEAK